MKSTVSVILPAYNVERFVSDALRSILNQTLVPHEVIVVDDGSTDSAYNELLKFSANERVKIFRTSNNGLGPARNLGKRLATGDYLYFFDSDDLLAENFFHQIELSIIKQNKPDAILFSAECFLDNNEEIGLKTDYKRKLDSVFDTGGAAIRGLLSSNSFKPNAWLYVIKKEIWQQSKLDFLPIIHEDEEIIFPLLTACRKVVVMRDIFVFHRIRQGSIMSKKPDAKNLEGYRAILRSLLAYYVRNPEDIHHERDLWENRIKDFSYCYVRLANELEIKLDVKDVIHAQRIVRSPIFFLQTIFYLLPAPHQRLIKKIVNFKDRTPHP